MVTVQPVGKYGLSWASMFCCAISVLFGTEAHAILLVLQEVGGHEIPIEIRDPNSLMIKYFISLQIC